LREGVRGRVLPLLLFNPDLRGLRSGVRILSEHSALLCASVVNLLFFT